MLKTGAGLNTTGVELHVEYHSSQLLDRALDSFEYFLSLWRNPEGESRKQRMLDKYDSIRK